MPEINSIRHLEEITKKGLLSYTNSLPSMWIIYLLSILQHVITASLPFFLIMMMSHLWFVSSSITYLQFAIGYILIGLLLSTLSIMKEQLFSRLLFKYSESISEETFSVMAKLPYNYLSNLPIESQYARYIPLENFSYIWLNDIVKPLLDLPLVIFSFAAICLILGFSYFAVVSLVLLLVLFVSNFKSSIDKGNKQEVSESEYLGTLKDTLNNINLIKSHGRIAFFKDKHTALITKKLHGNYLTETKSQILANIAESLLLLIYITSLIFSVYYALVNIISIQYLIIILLLTWFSISPLKSILAVFDSIPKAKTLIKQYASLTQIIHPVHRQKKLAINDYYDGEVNLQNLSYRFPNNSKFFLNNINFQINKGELLLIVGESGSGKSTLLKLISGLYTPTAGYVSIQHDVALIDEKSLREKVILLSNTSCFENASIIDNLQMSSNNTKVSDSIKNMLQELGLPPNISINDLKNQNNAQANNIISAIILSKIPETTRNKIILLDEPFITHNLNVYHQVANAINKIAVENTIIIASRYSFYSTLATNIVLLDNGTFEKHLTRKTDGINNQNE